MANQQGSGLFAGAGSLVVAEGQTWHDAVSFAATCFFYAPYYPPGTALLISSRVSVWVVSAASSSAVGTLSLLPRYRLPVTPALTGAGSLVVAERQTWHDAVLFAGAGTLVETTQERLPTRATVAGTGSFVTVPQVFEPAVAAFAAVGASAVNVPTLTLGTVPASLAAVGNFAVNVPTLVLGTVPAVFSGSGVTVVAEGQTWHDASAFFGTGYQDLPWSAVSTVDPIFYASVGGFFASLNPSVPASAAFAAVSSLGSIAFQVWGINPASFATVGSFNATSTVFEKAAVALTGAGSFIETTQAWLSTTATLAGTGSLVGTTQEWLPTTATFIGAGGLVVAEGQTWRDAALFAAAGFIVTTFQLQEAGSASFAGTGSIVEFDFQQHGAFTNWPGSGSTGPVGFLGASSQLFIFDSAALAAGGLFVSTTQDQLPTAVGFAATGTATFTAASLLLPASGLLAASGALSGTTQERLPTSSVFTGAGALTSATEQDYASNPAVFAGVGAVVTVTGQNYSINPAGFTGVGSLVVTEGQTWHNVAGFAAVGAGFLPWTAIYAVDPIIFGAIAALAVNAPVVRVAGSAVFDMTPHFPVNTWPGSVGFVGSGGLVTATRASYATNPVTFTGTGVLAPLIGQNYVTNPASFAGVGLLREIESVKQPGVSQGSGSFVGVGASTAGFTRLLLGPTPVAFAGSGTAVFFDPYLFLVVNPPNPSIPSNTPLGTSVATLTGVWSNGRPFNGNFVFVAPTYDDPPAGVRGAGAGVYAITQTAFGQLGNLIINPAGPGVGAAGGTIEDVTIVAADPPISQVAGFGGAGTFVGRASAKVFGSASFNAAGSLREVDIIIHNWLGSGFLAGTGSLGEADLQHHQQQGTGFFAAIGAERLPWTAIYAIDPINFAGAGALIAATRQLYVTNPVSFNGAGTLFEVDTQRHPPVNNYQDTPSVAAVGAFVATINDQVPAVVSVAGTGALAASTQQNYAINPALFVGAGTLVEFDIIQHTSFNQWPGSGGFLGAGLLTAATGQLYATNLALFSGTGAFVAAGSRVILDVVSFTGAAVLIANAPTIVLPDVSSFNGVGAASVLTGQVYGTNSALFAGVGAFVPHELLKHPNQVFVFPSFVGTGTTLLPWTAVYAVDPINFGGAGSFTEADTQQHAPTNQWPGATGFTGTGSFIASAAVSFTDVVTFTGAGALVPRELYQKGTHNQWDVLNNVFAGSAAWFPDPIINTLGAAVRWTVFRRVYWTPFGTRIIKHQFVYVRPPVLVSVAGAGRLAATPKLALPATAAFAGTAAFAAPELIYLAGKVQFSAVGAIAVPTTLTLSIAPAFAAIGALVAPEQMYLVAQAPFAGVGTLSAAFTPLQLAASPLFAGAGALSAAFTPVYQAVFPSFLGAGTLVETTKLSFNDTALFAGAGTLFEFDIIQHLGANQWPVSAGFIGAGAFIPAPLIFYAGAFASFASAGVHIAATGQIYVTNQASFIATDSLLTALPHLTLPTSASFAGSAGFVASSAYLVSATAAFAAAGTQAATYASPASVSASVAGLAALTSAAASLFLPSAAVFGSAGNFAASIGFTSLNQVAFAAAGSLSTPVGSVILNQGSFAAVASSSTLPGVQSNNAAIFAGAGTAVAVATTLATNALLLPGAGAFTALAEVRGAVTARFTAVGSQSVTSTGIFGINPQPFIAAGTFITSIGGGTTAAASFTATAGLTVVAGGGIAANANFTGFSEFDNGESLFLANNVLFTIDGLVVANTVLNTVTSSGFFAGFGTFSTANQAMAAYGQLAAIGAVTVSTQELLPSAAVLTINGALVVPANENLLTGAVTAVNGFFYADSFVPRVAGIVEAASDALSDSTGSGGVILSEAA